MSSRNVVIIGGNAGGGLMAARLKRLLPPDASIIVLDKAGKVEFQPSYTYVALGSRTEQQVSKDFGNISGDNVKAVKTEVTKVDAANRTVYTDTGEYKYDTLVLSPGARIIQNGFKGAEATYHFWDLQNALKTKDAIGKFRKGKIVISVSNPVYRCPPVPWEMSMMLHEYFTNKGLRDGIEITVAHPVEKPFEMFGPSISGPLTQWLEEMKIKGAFKFMTGMVDPVKKEVVSTNNESLKYDLAIVSPIHEPPDFVKNNDDLKSKMGWGDSNVRNFRNNKYDDIYAIGDLVAPSLGLGMAGVFAHFQADTAATFIADDLTGSYLTIPYNSVAACAMEGGSYGWFAYCDFARKLKDPKIPFPDCTVTGRGRIYKLMHAIYEKYYYASIFRGRN